MRLFIIAVIAFLFFSLLRGQDLSGVYMSETLSLSIFPQRSELSLGEITYNDETRPVYAVMKPDQGDLSGVFFDGEALFKFTFSGEHILNIGEKDYPLSRVEADPASVSGRLFTVPGVDRSISLDIAPDQSVTGTLVRRETSMRFQGRLTGSFIEGVLFVGADRRPEVTTIALLTGGLRITEGDFAGTYIESDSVWPEDLQRGSYFSLDQLFTGTPYEAYNQYSKKLILRQAQSELKENGVYTSSLDGLPGQGTQRAIVAWQAANGRSVTGRLDNETLLGLNLLAMSEQQPPRWSAADGEKREVLKTEEGIPLKIIARFDTYLLDGPSSEADSSPVRTFDIFYVLRPKGAIDPGGKTVNGFYEVTDGMDSEVSMGWVSARDAVEWPHRQAVGVIEASRRDGVPAKFFGSQDDLQRLYSGGRVRPMSREPKRAVGLNIIPILDMFEMEADGDKVNGYEVAYLHQLHQGASIVDSERVEIDKLSFDVVFVVDTTISMEPWIEATRELVRRMSERLRERIGFGDVRFGLVGYRDTLENPPEDWYTTRVFVSLDEGADFDRFLEKTAVVEEAAVSSGPNREEDVLAGVRTAIDPVSNRLGWKKDSLKHVIVIGDAAPELENNVGDQTIESVINLAQPVGAPVTSQFVLHSVALVDPNAPREFQERTIRQFRELSSMSNPLAKFRGISSSLSVDQPADALISELTDKGIYRTAEVPSEWKKKGEIPAELSDLDGVLGQEYTFEMLLATQEASDIPSFASGFACELDERGAMQLEPWVLVNRRRLNQTTVMIQAILTALEGSGEPGNRDLKRFLENLTNLTVSLNLDLDITGDTTPASIQQYILGIPAKTNAFNMTFQEIANMTQGDYEKWVWDVQDSRAKMEGVLEDPRNWYSINKSAQTAREAKEVKFIRVRDLP